MYDIVGLGACGVDYVTKVPRFSDDLHKSICNNAKKMAGGVTANNLVQAARLGLKVAYVGVLGNDEDSKFLLNEFRKEKVKAFAERKGRSQICWIIVNKAGENSIYAFPNATSSISPATAERFSEVLKNTRHFHSEINITPLRAIIKAAKISKKAGAKFLLDVDNDPLKLLPYIGTKKELDEVLRLADVIKMSQAAAKRLKVKGRLTVITKGSKGCIIGGIFCRAPKVKVVDTTGAGDAFMGGLSFALLKKMAMKEAGNFSNACGAVCCTKLGARGFGGIYDVRNILVKRV